MAPSAARQRSTHWKAAIRHFCHSRLLCRKFSSEFGVDHWGETPHRDGLRERLLAALRSILRSRAALELENLALRHQIGVLRRSAKRRAKLTSLDRLFWAWLSHIWCDWRSALTIVQPETVIAWHRRGFDLFWAWKIRRGQPGRPTLAYEVRELIRRMCRENPTWGTVVPASPRITQFWSKVRTLW